MTLLERYNALLDQRAVEEREKATKARAAGDEREFSIHLMQASMLGEMLKTLGRVEHEKTRPGILQAQIAALKMEGEKQRKKEDFDAADRTMTKMETIAFALETLKKLETEDE